MKLTNESLKKLVTEVINAEQARMDAWLQNFMDNMSDEKKAEIAARNEKEYAKAPNSDVPLSYVKAQVAKKEKYDLLQKRAREREAETKKGFSSKREISCVKVVCSKCYKKHLVDARTLWAKQSIKEER